MIGFNNASLLSFQANNKYLGDNSFNFAIEKNLSIQGYLYDVYSTSGIGSGILTGFNTLDIISNSSVDDIIINGKNFGKGYVQNIDVSNGNWVRLANYTADILILDSGDLYNMSGIFYPDISGSQLKNHLAPLIFYANDISTSTEVSKNFNGERSYEIKDSIQISMNPAFSGAEENARKIYNYLKRDDIFTEIDPFSISGTYKTYLSESIDNINKKYNFEKTIVQLIGNPSGSNFFEFSVSLEDDGIVNASEKSRQPKLNSIGTGGISSYFVADISLLEKDKNNQSGGLSEFLNIYGISAASLRVVGQSFGETDEYYEREISYSNQNINIGDSGISSFSFKISKNINKNDDGTTSSSATISIDGDGEPGSESKWSNAIAGFNSKKSEIETMAMGGISENPGYPGNDPSCGSFSNPFIDNFSISISNYNGTINYSVNAMNKIVQATGTDGQGQPFVQYQTVRDEPPRTEYKEYTIFGGDNGNALVQEPYPQLSLGKKIITVTRKYQNDVPFEQLELPEFGNEPDFTISKTARRSDGVAEIELVHHYH